MSTLNDATSSVESAAVKANEPIHERSLTVNENGSSSEIATVPAAPGIVTFALGLARFTNAKGVWAILELRVNVYTPPTSSTSISEYEVFAAYMKQRVERRLTSFPAVSIWPVRYATWHALTASRTTGNIWALFW